MDEADLQQLIILADVAHTQKTGTGLLISSYLRKAAAEIRRLQGALAVARQRIDNLEHDRL